MMWNLATDIDPLGVIGDRVMAGDGHGFGFGD